LHEIKEIVKVIIGAAIIKPENELLQPTEKNALLATPSTDKIYPTQ